MKEFVFCYPIPEYFDSQIDNHVFGNKKDAFIRKYKGVLNHSVNLRYRQNGYRINYTIFSNHEISDLIIPYPEDRIIDVGLDFKTHTTKQPDGKYIYPNFDKVLDQFSEAKSMRIGGFHMWDCVEKIAKKAYERGLDVLVDEDLTEFLIFRLNDSSFRIDKYPTFDPKELGDFSRFFFEARVNKPWLWQEYQSMVK